MKERSTRRHLLVEERLEPHVGRRGQGLREFDQLLQRKAGPGNGHRPGFDAAMAIEALLEPYRLDQRVDVDGLFLLDEAVELDRPGSRLQRARIEALVGAELIEIVVGEIVFLGRHVAIERVCRIALGGIKSGGRVGVVSPGPAGPGDEGARRAKAGEKRATVNESRLRRGQACRNFPSSSTNDVHGQLLAIPIRRRRRDGSPSALFSAQAWGLLRPRASLALDFLTFAARKNADGPRLDSRAASQMWLAQIPYC